VSAPKYFFDLGSRAAVAHALSRLVKGNKLKRIAGGLYEYPRTKPILGELSPDLNKVAANLLHLSEQVPMKVVFLSDGISKTARIGNQSIKLRKASPKRMQLAGKISGLVFEALREIGKEHINEQHIQTLQQELSDQHQGKTLN
jgi:hypothetical protein